jgi:hypothetical protein
MSDDTGYFGLCPTCHKTDGRDRTPFPRPPAQSGQCPAIL